MCDPDLREVDKEIARREAKRRAQIAQKCPVLRLVDEVIEKAPRGSSIFDVLCSAWAGVDHLDAGAADTIKKLLELEGGTA